MLITGDVASEGVNLHLQCHHLVHYDIPWSLIRIEQRNGRIDRYGQRHRPEITTLLLTPSTERFAGDIRILTRLVEREHEAHTALGDAASLMGTYDVKAEEERHPRSPRGQRGLRFESKKSRRRRSGGRPGRLLRQPGNRFDRPRHSRTHGGDLRGGRHRCVHIRLRIPLRRPRRIHQDPSAAPPNGVSWTVHTRQSIASLVPPRDLRQRLEVLPQSYLQERKVTESFKLAYTTLRGEEELRQARTGTSKTTWPEAHFLAPLHPIIDWAADRALAELGRNQIFAVRGDVTMTTILTQVTQTNTRGQVVAASYYTVAFPDSDNRAVAFATPHDTPASAVAALGLSSINPANLKDADTLQPLVATAVTTSDAAANEQADAIRHETQERVREWTARSQQWKQQASGLVQRLELKQRTARVAEEEELASAMNPDRRLARPLIVVVPQDFAPGTGA